MRWRHAIAPDNPATAAAYAAKFDEFRNNPGKHPEPELMPKNGSF